MFSSNATPKEEFAYADKLGAIINLVFWKFFFPSLTCFLNLCFRASSFGVYGFTFLEQRKNKMKLNTDAMIAVLPAQLYLIYCGLH